MPFPSAVIPFNCSEYLPGRVSRLMPAIPYQVLLGGSKEKKTACSSHFPETDFNWDGAATWNTTGDPLTSRAGCARADQTFEPVFFSTAEAAPCAARDSALNTTLVTRRERFLRQTTADVGDNSTLELG